MIAIIGDEPDWHGRELARAFASQGLDSTWLALADCRLSVGTDAPAIHMPGLTGTPAGVFVRGIGSGGLEQIILRMDMLHALRAQSIPVYNTPRAIERSVDKPLTSLLLSRAGLPTPATWVCESREQALSVLREQQAGGHVPLVQKPIFGAQGHGIRQLSEGEPLADGPDYGNVYYLQHQLRPPGEEWFDYRVLVIANHAVAAMRRCSRNWPTNRAQGARCETQPLSATLRELAEQASQVLDMDYAGVDIMPDRDGSLYVLEVNSIPAWRGLQQTCDLPIADWLVADFIRRLRPGQVTIHAD